MTEQRYERIPDPAWAVRLENLNGVWWFDAPRPSVDHECTPQTKSRIYGAKIDRCACGGKRLFGGRWKRRNSR